MTKAVCISLARLAYRLNYWSYGLVVCIAMLHSRIDLDNLQKVPVHALTAFACKRPGAQGANFVSGNTGGDDIQGCCLQRDEGCLLFA